jgi:hypothetical protein
MARDGIGAACYMWIGLKSNIIRLSVSYGWRSLQQIILFLSPDRATKHPEVCLYELCIKTVSHTEFLVIHMSLWRTVPSGGALFSAFQNLQKTTISLVMCVCMSVRPSACHNSAPIGRIFMIFYIWGLIVPLKSDKNVGYFKCRPLVICGMSLNSF